MLDLVVGQLNMLIADATLILTASLVWFVVSQGPGYVERIFGNG